MSTCAAVQGDKHGCPYKTLDSESLRAALGRLRVAGPAAEEAVRLARGGHFQLACDYAFAGAHGGCQCDTGINHPNQARRKTLERAFTTQWSHSHRQYWLWICQHALSVSAVLLPPKKH